jgi:hypothetical protein
MRTLDPMVIEAAKAFLGALVYHGGTAHLQDIPRSMDRVEYKARSACRQRGYACYHKTPAHWAIAPRGRRVAAKEIPW